MTATANFFVDASDATLYHVVNATGFGEFRDAVNGGNTFEGKTVALDADIDLDSVEWSPIGGKDSNLYFKGVFDGGNHKIEGLKISGNATIGTTAEDYAALFGATEDATVKNLSVYGSVSCDCAAGVVAMARNNTIIDNVKSYVAVTSTKKHAGGIVCSANYSGLTGTNIIRNCTNYGAVTINETSKAEPHAGGIAGICYANVMFSNCVNEAAITATIGGTAKFADMGGILGYTSDGSANIAFDSCVNKANISSSHGANIGGIAGKLSCGSGRGIYADLQLLFKNCENYGTLTADNTGIGAYIAGIVASQGAASAAEAVKQVQGYYTVLKGQKFAGNFTPDVSPICSVDKGEYRTSYMVLADALAAVAADPENKTLAEVSESVWAADKEVYYNGKFYTMSDAIVEACKANSSDPALLYVRPNHDGLTVTHDLLKTSITIFGNNASVRKSTASEGAWEPSIEGDSQNNGGIDNSANGDCKLEKDVSHAVYSLHNGASFWGTRITTHVVNLTFVNCTNAHEVLTNTKSTGRTNFKVKNCTFEYTDDKQTPGTRWPIVNKGPGSMEIENCSFTGGLIAINGLMEQAGERTLTVKDCTFTNVAGEGAAKGVIRLAGEAVNTSEATIDNCTFVNCATASGAPILSVGKNNATENLGLVTCTVVNTEMTKVNVFTVNTADTDALAPTSIVESETAVTFDNSGVVHVYVAQIGSKKYETMSAALSAAKSGDTVEVLLAGTYALKNFAANVTVTGTVDGVIFDCTSKAGGCIADVENATFDNVTFKVGTANCTGFNYNYPAYSLTMRNCTIEGMFFTYGAMTFEKCTFKRLDDGDPDYCMWVYNKSGTPDPYTVKYDECVFETKGKALNVYCEGSWALANVVVKNCTFKNNGNPVKKPAVLIKSKCNANELTYTVKFEGTNTLEGNWPSATSLYTDGNVKNNGLWDVEGDGTKITVYVNGSQVYPSLAAKIGDVNYETLEAAIKAVKNDETIVLLADNAETFEAAPADGVTNFTIQKGGYALTGKVTLKDETYRFVVSDDKTYCTYGANPNKVKIVGYYGTVTEYETLEAALVVANQLRDYYITIRFIDNAVCTNALTLQRSNVSIELEGKELAISGDGSFVIQGSNVWIGNGTIKSANGDALWVTGSDVMAEGLTATGRVIADGAAGNICVSNCTITADGALTARGAGVILAYDGTYSGGETGAAIAIPAELSARAHIIVREGTYSGKVDAKSGLADIRAGKFTSWSAASDAEILITGGTYDADPSAFVDEHYEVKTNTPSEGLYTVSCKYAAKMVAEDTSVMGWYEDLQTPVDMIRAGTVGVIVLLKDESELTIPEDCEIVHDEDGDTTLIVYTYLFKVEAEDTVGKSNIVHYCQTFENVCKIIEDLAQLNVTPDIIVLDMTPEPPADYKYYDNGTTTKLVHKVYTCQTVDKDGNVVKQYETYEEAAEDMGTGSASVMIETVTDSQYTSSSSYQNLTNAWSKLSWQGDTAITQEGYTLRRIKNSDNTYSYTLEVYVAQIGDTNLYTTFEAAIAAKVAADNDSSSPLYKKPIIVKNYSPAMVPPEDWKFVQTGDQNIFQLVAKVYICSIGSDSGKKYETFEEAIEALSAEEASGELLVLNYEENKYYAPSGWKFKQNSSGSWILAQYVATGSELGAEVTLEANGTGVDREEITKVISDIFVVSQIESVTEVLGVKLTMLDETNSVGEVTTPSGVQRVVTAAKDDATAKNNKKFLDALASSENVTIKVEVSVAALEYTPSSASQGTGLISFSLAPTATVIAASSSGVVTNKVAVSNDMIDQNQLITVSLYTGFNPAQILHRADDGTLIREYTGSDITYAADTGIAQIKINHFSTLTANATAEYAAKIGTTNYLTLEDAVKNVTSGQTITLLADNAESFTTDKTVAFSIDAGTYAFTGTITTADGYRLTANGTTYSYAAIPYVAQVGSTKYETLKAAVDAATAGQTITMIADATVDATISVTKSVKIDLNEKTLTSAVVGWTFTIDSGILAIWNGTVVDGAGGRNWGIFNCIAGDNTIAATNLVIGSASAPCVTDDGAIFRLRGGNTALLDNIVIYTDDRGICANGDSENNVVVTGEASKYYITSSSGGVAIISSENTRFAIDGLYIESARNGIDIEGGSCAAISNVVVKCPNSNPLYVSASTATIVDSTLESGKNTIGVASVGSVTVKGGTYSTTSGASGDAVLKVYNSGGLITVESGAFANSGNNGYVAYADSRESGNVNVGTDAQIALIDVADGSYVGNFGFQHKAQMCIAGGCFGGKVALVGDPSYQHLTITGGLFTLNPTNALFNAGLNCLADGYEVEDNIDTATKVAYPFLVKRYVALVGSTKYETLAAAVAAAKDAGADTVTLLADCTIDSEVVVGQDRGDAVSTSILCIEGTNSVAGGYYTVTVKDGGKLTWDYYFTAANFTLNANVIDQTTAGNGLYLRGYGLQNSTGLYFLLTLPATVERGSQETFYGIRFCGPQTFATLSLNECYFEGSVAADTVARATCYGSVTATSITGGTFYGTVNAGTISGGNFYDAAITVNAISGGYFYSYDAAGYAALREKLDTGKTMVYANDNCGHDGYSVVASSDVGAIALRNDETIQYANAYTALKYSAANDIVTMLTAYYANLTLPNTVTLVISNSTKYRRQVLACDNQHSIQATAFDGGTNYVNVVNPENAAAYIVHGTTTNYCTTVAGAISDAAEGDAVLLKKNCAEDLTLKVGVTLFYNGHEMTGTCTPHSYCVAVTTSDSITERYREADEDGVVASLDASERTLYFVKVGAAVQEAYYKGTTVKLLKDVTLTNADVQESGGCYFICNAIGDGKTFDGDGHTVTYTGSTVCNFITSLSGTIKNATFTGLKQGVVRDMHHGAAFTNVKVMGTVQYDAWNWGAFADNVYADRLNNSCSFTDCEMAVSFTADSMTNGECHNGAFVGWLDGTNTLNFTRCRVTGNMRCGMAGMFIGNVAYTDTYTLNVTDCYNEGLLNSVYPANQDETYPYYFNPIVGYSSEDRLSRITVNLKQGDAELATYTGIDQLTNAVLFAALKRNGGEFVNGNVVASVTTAGDEPVTTYYATLSNAFDAAQNGYTVTLLQNVDLGGKLWTPVQTTNRTFTFDGNNKTISNLTVTNNVGDNVAGGCYAGLFYELRGTVKDITFANPIIVGNRCGVVAGACQNGWAVVSNVTVTSAKIVGHQKCGGIIGMIAASGGVNLTIKNCVVDGLSITENENPNCGGGLDHGLWGAGGIIGYLGSTTTAAIMSNKVADVKIEDANRYRVDNGGAPFTQSVSHAFIGSICNMNLTSDVDKYTSSTVTLLDNETSQCPETEVYRYAKYHEFVGSYSNWDLPLGGYPYPTKLVIDGVEITKPYAKIGTTYYLTLQAAFDAVKEGQTIYVLAANTENITVTNTCSFTFNSNGYALSGEVSVPTGYRFTQNDNVCTYAAIPYVAQIVTGTTTNKYETIQAAVDAASGDTITMIADVDYGDASTAGFTIPSDKTITLDLNGVTITNAPAAAKGSVLVQVAGILTIDDSSEGKTGKIVSNPLQPCTGWSYGNYTIQLGSTGKLTVNNGTIENTATGGARICFAVEMTSGSELVVNGGNLKSNASVIRAYSSEVDTPMKVTVNNGNLTGSTPIYYQGGGAADITVNGGVLTGTAYAVYLDGPKQNVNVTITGGTLKATNSNGKAIASYLYNAPTGSNLIP